MDAAHDPFYQAMLKDLRAGRLTPAVYDHLYKAGARGVRTGGTAKPAEAAKRWAKTCGLTKNQTTALLDGVRVEMGKPPQCRRGRLG